MDKSPKDLENARGTPDPFMERGIIKGRYMSDKHANLTERQRRELEYHREHAKQHRSILNRPFSYDVIYAKKHSRWWNAAWEMYSFLNTQELRNKKVLVVGCGFGEDALRLAKMGAQVEALDLSPESLSVAKELASREKLQISFREMPVETMDYESDIFDFVVARDILHHVDIPAAMNEIIRTSKNGALFVVNEVYTHSFTDRIRHSAFVEKKLYPAMQSFVYEGEQPYITEDERKLTEKDVAEIVKPLKKIVLKKHFNFLVNRVAPDKYDFLSKIDRAILAATNPIAHILGGRVLLGGVIEKIEN